MYSIYFCANQASRLLSRNDENGSNPSEVNKATTDARNPNLEKAGTLVSLFTITSLYSLNLVLLSLNVVEMTAGSKGLGEVEHQRSQ